MALWKKRICLILNIQQNLNFVFSVFISLERTALLSFWVTGIQLNQCFAVRNSVFFLPKYKRRLVVKTYFIMTNNYLLTSSREQNNYRVNFFKACLLILIYISFRFLFCIFRLQMVGSNYSFTYLHPTY